MSDLSLLEQLRKLISWKKSRSFYASKLGVSLKEVDELMEELKNSKNIGEEAETANYIAELEDKVYELVEDRKNGTQQITARFSEEIKTLEELIEKCNIDIEVWNIDKYVQNFWGNAKNPHWQVKAFLSKKRDFDPQKFSEFLKDFKPPKITYIPIPDSPTKESVDVLISIADFHLDRATLKDDTLQSRSDEYCRIVDSLVVKAASSYKINKLYLIIGNDYFNSDTFFSTTTNGTPQKDLGSFSESYEMAFSTLVKSVMAANPYTEKIEVILVQGNHDRTKSYYLAHALDIFFQWTENVSVNKEDSLTKFIVSGNTFIGFHHGNTKIEELPLVFATSANSSAQFGLAKFREVLTADKHHYMAKEIKGVRIQQMPSMANPSRWEVDNNFINNVRAGLAIIYHPVKGRVGELEERL